MIPLRIACIGKHGQTAQALAGVAAGYPSIELHQAGREAADLTNAAALEAFIHQSQAHVVINAGAYNLVDKAESDEATAFRGECRGAAHAGAAVQPLRRALHPYVDGLRIRRRGDRASHRGRVAATAVGLWAIKAGGRAGCCRGISRGGDGARVLGVLGVCRELRLQGDRLGAGAARVADRVGSDRAANLCARYRHRPAPPCKGEGRKRAGFVRTASSGVARCDEPVGHGEGDHGRVTAAGRTVCADRAGDDGVVQCAGEAAVECAAVECKSE
jgi:hypothetical protein